MEGKRFHRNDGTRTSPGFRGVVMALTHAGRMDSWRLPLNDRALAERIEDNIERKACGRIRDLRVVCWGNTIILNGRSRTHHAKQLAQAAVLDLTDTHAIVTNQIVVRY